MSTSGCEATATRPSRPLPAIVDAVDRAATASADRSPRRSPSPRRAAGSARSAPRAARRSRPRRGRRPAADRRARRRPRARSVPIEPVDPRIAMRFMRITRTFRNDVVDRRREQQRVDPIEDAAVAGNQRRAVFDAGAALQHRLEQIAGDAERDDARGRGRRATRTGMPGTHHAPATTNSAVPNTKPPIAPSIVFFGLIAGASGRRPKARPV